MRQQIIRLGIGLMVGYLVLFAQLNRLQFFNAEELETHPVNSRPLVEDFGAPRGEIRAADGTVLARSVELEEGVLEREREYPLGELFAEVTGFVSFDAGSDGLESSFDDELRGDRNALSDGLRELLGGESTTADVNTTLSVELQEVARDALGERNGSVVALDPQTGEILALWSYPTYDPNTLADIDNASAQEARRTLLADPGNPLLPRTYREVYFPGSTFKMVTAASAIENEIVTLDAPVFPASDGYTPPLTERPFGNFDGSTCGGPLRDLIRVSCNSGFAQLAVELIGGPRLIETAEDFGFNQELPLDLPRPTQSVMPDGFGAALGTDVELAPELAAQFEEQPEPVPLTDNIPALAQSSSGQFDVRATPLQMALVAAAIANDGDVPTPHVVSTVVDSVGTVITEADNEPWRNAIEAETAAALREAMLEVVVSGTGTSMAVDGVVVGAKTGTAQIAESLEATHAWAIAFAGDTLDSPEIAIAVLIEADAEIGEQTGGRVAGPVAQALISAWANGVE